MSAPAAKALVIAADPNALAGLLYLGAGLALSLIGRTREAEAPLRPADVPLLAGVIVAGGMVGPVLFLIGLARVSGIVGSLSLNLEAPFTMGLAVLFFGEHLGRRETIAAGIVLLGGVMLGGTAAFGRVAGSVWGALAVAGACLAWALDNNLTQRLSVRDPIAVARMKTLAAGSGNLLLAIALGDRFPSGGALLAALIVGAFGYGVSIVFDTYALRAIGAAREAAYFAMAPFFGVLFSLLLLEEHVGAAEAVTAGVMLVGITLLFREHHEHEHVHSVLTHEHRHRHDDHHRHVHDSGTPLGEPHSHVHTHAAVRHRHPHVSDVHHRHRH
jgi:drug/metabolite transporter (DMT)-like permease